MKKSGFLKNNKTKIIIFSGTMAGILGLSAGLGFVVSYKAKNDNKQFLYKPGEIKFDESGKLLIPTVVDPDNLAGIYEYKIEETKSIDIPKELKENKKIVSDIKKEIDNSVKTIKEKFSEILDKELTINNNLKMLFDNLIPANNINNGEKILVNNLIDSIADASTTSAFEKSLSTQDISNMMALNGINFAKEYNDLNKQINTDEITLYGGNASPNKPKPPSSITDNIEKDFSSYEYIESTIKILKQDFETRFIIAIANMIDLFHSA